MSYRAQIEGALRAMVITSPTSYSWFGRRSQRLPARLERILTARSARDYLRTNLQLQLYADFYARGAASPADALAAAARVEESEFVEKLSAANLGRGSLHGGWEVRALVDGGARVEKGGLALFVRTEQCRIADGDELRRGLSISLPMPNELRSASPGYYVALGDVGGAEVQGPVVRLYWHVTPSSAAAFVARTTGLLNPAGIPFTLKVVTDPSQFRRCDSGVLYLRQDDFATAASLLEPVYAELRAGLRDQVPALTKRLAPGVGLAEDPGGGESFGLHRCGLLADAAISGYERDAKELARRVAIVEERFAREGLDLERPYLGPESSDRYEFEVLLTGAGSPRRRREKPAAVDRESFLGVADGIARRLVGEAVWHQDRCTWIGARVVGNGRAPAVAQGSLGGDLYDGTAGIAVFLAELAARTGDRATRRAALGAIRHSLSRTRRNPHGEEPGLYFGWTSTVLAAARVAAALDEDEPRHEAAEIAKREISRGVQRPHSFDLLSGLAGMIVALLAAGPALEVDTVEPAAELGEELLARGERGVFGLSWSAPGHRSAHLTGLSHGVSGAALALVELFAATGSARFRAGAEAAFDYERRWFAPEHRNWPDLREQPRSVQPGDQRLSFVSFWCHGAPGIALARARAVQVLGSQPLDREREAALSTTREALEAERASSFHDFGLCHGLAGNAEILRIAHFTAGDAAEDPEGVAAAVAAEGMERYGDGRRPWPCGLGGAATPALMVGLAGVGHFYLRTHDRSVPSVLGFQPVGQRDRDALVAGAR